MRRLYLQIYLGFLGVCALLTLVAALMAWHLRRDHMTVPPFVSGVMDMLGDTLPAAGGPPETVRRALIERADQLGLHATLWSATGERIASVGPQLPAPPLDADGPVWIRVRRGPPGVVQRLADGRFLAVTIDRDTNRRARHWPLALAIFAGAIALGAYPIARRIAGRLERLREGVERLGAGDLSSRVPIEGRDEVAALARSFNRTADRIETLVQAQGRMLASASHELRSPLARLRVALELMADADRPELRREAEADIAELDELIEDLLLSARLESGGTPLQREPVELLALVSEEAARVDASVTGEPCTVEGDPRMLRRLARNLLENARRHGGSREGDIEASVTSLPDGRVRITVMDRGPGVPAHERERIFEPFYRPEGHSEGRDGGVGLGLALVREIARQHGGDARCLPREGGGTVFEVELGGAGSVAPPASPA